MLNTGDRHCTVKRRGGADGGGTNFGYTANDGDDYCAGYACFCTLEIVAGRWREAHGMLLGGGEMLDRVWEGTQHGGAPILFSKVSSI